MAPNSEEDAQISLFNRRGWAADLVDKEPLRPPVYNPEDYATSLKKWGKKGSSGAPVPQYMSQSTSSLEKLSESELFLRKKRQSSPSTKSSSSIKSADEKHSKKDKESTMKTEKKDLKNKENINRGLKSDLQKDFLTPILNVSSQTGEMTLRQFSSVTELLAKLKVDLKSSFPSFVQEFVGDPIDGVTLLLELLRCVQLTQTSQQQRCPPQILRRALLDEHSCLICLQHCLRCPDASRRLASSPAGLFTLAVCIMSNVTQSRIIALELLARACEPRAGGHKAVSEALSTLRLRFGEPVRFRFLIGMLSSAGAVELLTASMKFINVFVESAPSLQQKVYIQAELEQAGFHSDILRKSLPSNSESVKAELNKWEKNYFDVEKLRDKVTEVNVLQEKVHLLEKRIKILQEEKGILQSLEQCLKERCSELEEKVSIKTNASMKPFRNRETNGNAKPTEKGESTPAEDEGISSSEQEMSQDEDYVKRAIPYDGPGDIGNVMKLKKIKRGNQAATETNRYTDEATSNRNLKNLKNVRSKEMKESNVDDGNEIVTTHGDEKDEDEEETTIDEVIEELENIVNDVETEALAGEEEPRRTPEMTRPTSVAAERQLGSRGTCLARRGFASQEKIAFEESEIVPANLHPQPPKKAKSLIHIYFPGSDPDSHSCNKNEFFEGSDSETSDSLLTAAREEKSSPEYRRYLEISHSFDSYSSANTRTLFIKQEQEIEEGNYEERNIDEEESKRKHLRARTVLVGEISSANKNSQKHIEKVQKETIWKAEETKAKANAFGFRALGSSFVERASIESPFPRRTPELVPTPVKRSQTFHTTSLDGENLHKKLEIKPKPKMGVRGLDFQRSTEQKVKNENCMYRVIDSEKKFESQAKANSQRFPRELLKKERDAEFKTLTGIQSSEQESSKEAFPVSRKGPEQDKESPAYPDRRQPAIRVRSTEKIDEGLDSLVDIVISSDKSKKVKLKSEWNTEVSKNIGPRTRRSLAESSLFCSQLSKNNNEHEDGPKPPKPAQRTSLVRNNSSAAPVKLPVQIQIAPFQLGPQQCTYLGLKATRSAENLLSPLQSKRPSPDGSSTAIDSRESQHTRSLAEDRPFVYSTPVKPMDKIQTFFGNPKFNGPPSGEQFPSRNYFESNYAALRKDKLPSSRPQESFLDPHSPLAKTQQERSKNQPTNKSGFSAAVGSVNMRQTGEKDGSKGSKPSFLLGTYQSQPSRISSTSPKEKTSNSSVLRSIDSFNNNKSNNNNSLAEKSISSSNEYSRGRRKGGDVDKKPSSSVSGKFTDSPSGLY